MTTPQRFHTVHTIERPKTRRENGGSFLHHHEVIVPTTLGAMFGLLIGFGFGVFISFLMSHYGMNEPADTVPVIIGCASLGAGLRGVLTWNVASADYHERQFVHEEVERVEVETPLPASDTRPRVPINRNGQTIDMPVGNVDFVFPSGRIPRSDVDIIFRVVSADDNPRNQFARSNLKATSAQTWVVFRKYMMGVGGIEKTNSNNTWFTDKGLAMLREGR